MCIPVNGHAYSIRCSIGTSLVLDILPSHAESIHKLYPAHPCSYPHAYLHAICVVGAEKKTDALKAAGFWFLDDGR
jgi:hypothetical protein